MRWRNVCFALLWLATGVLLMAVTVLYLHVKGLEDKIDKLEQPQIHRWEKDN